MLRDPDAELVAIDLGGGSGSPWRLVETTSAFERYEISLPDLRFESVSDQDWYKLLSVPPYRLFPSDAPGCRVSLEVLYGIEEPFDLHIKQVEGEDLQRVDRQRSFHDLVFVGELPFAVEPGRPLWMRFTPTLGADDLAYGMTLRFIKPGPLGELACSIPVPP